MKLKKIKLVNIRSYKEQEIEFPEGSLLLSGDIGSGKTSILLAIEYALFGLQPGQKGSSLLRNNEQSGGVILEFEIGGRNVIIERKLKRSPKGIGNEYASITLDGQKQESSITEIKSKIVSLLGYPPEFVKKNNILYRFTIYTAQEQMKQIILEDTETRVNILRHIFGIDKYRQIKNNSAIFVNDLKTDSKVLQSELATLEKDRENLKIRKSDLEILKRKILECREKLSEKLKQKENLGKEFKELETKIEEKKVFEREIEKTKILLSTKKELLASLNREEGEIKQMVAEAGEPFNENIYFDIKNQIKTKKEIFDIINSAHLDILAKANFLRQEHNDILLKKEKIFKIDICPTCLQNVPERHKHNILNETETKLVQISTMLEGLDLQRGNLSEKIEKQKNEISGLEEKKMDLEILKSRVEHLEKSKNKLAELIKQKRILDNDQSLLVGHIENLKEKLLQHSMFEFQFKKKETELKQAVLEEKNIEIALAELEKESELSNKEIVLLEENLKRKEESKKRLYELNELIDWISYQFLKLIELAERNVLIKLRKEFSNLFRKWFLMLVAESNLDSQIDESFTPIILQGETEMDYSYLSGGERTAVALAYRLALSQTITSLMSKIKTKGLIILDEPTDGFSETQINKIREILEELDAEQLIVVSHEQKIESFVDNVIRIFKEGDVSSVESFQTGYSLKSKTG